MQKNNPFSVGIFFFAITASKRLNIVILTRMVAKHEQEYCKHNRYVETL